MGLLGSAFIKEIRREGGTGIVADIKAGQNLSDNEIFLDITDENSVNTVIREILDRHGRIDGWINNAYPRTGDWGLPFEEIPYDSWRKNVDMHLNGYFLCSQKVLEVMSDQGSGSLINMASIYGVVAPDFSIYEDTNMTMPAAYAAIKGGIVQLTRYLAAYYGPKNIRVNCISPGGIFDNQDPVFVDRYNSKVPLGRMAGPEDIAPFITLLLSDESAYITGQNITIDGGFSI